jgi:hypothetical protein
VRGVRSGSWSATKPRRTRTRLQRRFATGAFTGLGSLPYGERKRPLSRAFSQSGRRDLNSGPLVPQGWEGLCRFGKGLQIVPFTLGKLGSEGQCWATDSYPDSDPDRRRRSVAPEIRPHGHPPSSSSRMLSSCRSQPRACLRSPVSLRAAPHRVRPRPRQHVESRAPPLSSVSQSPRRRPQHRAPSAQARVGLLAADGLRVRLEGRQSDDCYMAARKHRLPTPTTTDEPEPPRGC